MSNEDHKDHETPAVPVTTEEVTHALLEKTSDAEGKMERLFGQWEEEIGNIGDYDHVMNLEKRKANFYESVGRNREALESVGKALAAAMEMFNEKETASLADEEKRLKDSIGTD